MNKWWMIRPGDFISSFDLQELVVLVVKWYEHMMTNDDRALLPLQKDVCTRIN